MIIGGNQMASQSSETALGGLDNYVATITTLTSTVSERLLTFLRTIMIFLLALLMS